MRFLTEKARSFSLFVRYPAAKQFAKFCFVGTSSTAIDFGFYIGLTRAIDFFAEHYLLANAIAFIAAASWGYTFNRKWTFRSDSPRVARQYMQFFIVSLIGLALNSAILAGLVNAIDLLDIVAKAGATGVVLFWNYFANRLWTFRPIRQPADTD